MTPNPTRPVAFLVSLLVIAGGTVVTPAAGAPMAGTENEGPLKCTGLFVVDNPLLMSLLQTMDGLPLWDSSRGLCNVTDNANRIHSSSSQLQPDRNGDGAGDPWQEEYVLWALSEDLDTDMLGDLEEFYWLTNPLNADTDIDNWLDGPEAAYWSRFASGTGFSLGPYAAAAPGAILDTDGDRTPNMHDRDSDNDRLLDGNEASYSAKPELRDTDADGLLDGQEVLDYGTKANAVDSDNDDFQDPAEVQYWLNRGATPKTTDSDNDGLRNVRDPDSDNDGLLDGTEIQQNCDPLDSDTDNDAMPDAWEALHGLRCDANDASLDADGDSLANLAEYEAGTDPQDMDSEDDLLLDGEEVLTFETNPLSWDTDLDGMADRFETTNDLNPLNAADAALDPDGDSFDRGLDGSIDQAWTNLQEYRSGRPVNHDETVDGPWLFGTNPHDPDTDGDGALDGYEAYYETDPNLPVDVSADEDKDGLNFTLEVLYETDPDDPDTDSDGLCDGGRAENCFVPDGSLGNQPGERDYATIPWATDTDEDGLDDGSEAELWDSQATGQAEDLDADGLGGMVDADSDNDGLSDGAGETWYGTDLRNADTDADRLTDGDEVDNYDTDPLLPDSDDDDLSDGDEVEIHHTWPNNPDTDSDGLNDGAELVLGSDPFNPDTDADQVPDGWEAAHGTSLRVPDAEQDPDLDGLTNGQEYELGTHPTDDDTDDDDLPDGWEAAYGLNALVADASSDFDGDGLTNAGERTAGTFPNEPDTDGDAGLDGWEVNTADTNPLEEDSDLDGLTDRLEYLAWVAPSPDYPWNTDSDGDSLKGLLDPDSDNDGLNDRDELLDTLTKPHVADSDGDGVSDFDEIVTFGGQFDPNKADTDGDGLSDKNEAAVAEANGDSDADGLKDTDEVTYGTEEDRADSDCDGVRDGAELTYWGENWNAGGNRLLNPDADGDSIKDGIEIGTVGTPSQALYRTRPDLADSDGDWLNDQDEARNNVKVICPLEEESAPMSSQSFGSFSLTELVENPVQEAENGLLYVLDEAGGYILGGYGVHLYPDGVSLTDLLNPGTQAQAGGAPAAGTNGRQTDPALPDTDGDGLRDGEEVQGSMNPYKDGKSNSALPDGNTDPLVCDSDHDGLGDGLEVGMTTARAVRSNTAAVCRQRDTQSSTQSDPNNDDTDGDTRTDGPMNKGCGASAPANAEDKNCNGLADGLLASTYCASAGSETDAVDADSDDDGLPDVGDIDSTCFDFDYDGLSDGLERGVRGPVPGTNILSTVQVGGLVWPRWQAYNGDGLLMTNPRVADSDSDGLIDGLEDVNHNGIFGDYASALGTAELNARSDDTDNDKIKDGKELLVYGSYQFPDIMQAWGGSFGQLVFDSGNPFETNPRDATTDADSVIDGKDILPRGDALLNFGYGAFRQIDPIDDGNGPCHPPQSSACQRPLWEVDLMVTTSLDTPAGNYVFRTIKIDNWYTKNERTFSDLPGGEVLELASDQTKPAAVATQLAVVGQAVSIDLPENVDVFSRKDPNIVLSVDVTDYDPVGAHDVIDVNNRPHEGGLIETFSLTAGPKWGVRPSLLIGNGGADGVGDDDGLVKVTFGHNLLPYFVETALAGGVVGLPEGTCQGYAGCVL